MTLTFLRGSRKTGINVDTLGVPQKSAKKTTKDETPCAGHKGFFSEEGSVDVQEIRLTSWGWYFNSHHLPGFYDHPKWLDIGYLNYQQYDPPFFPPPNHRPSSKSRRLASKKSKRSFTKRGDRFRSSKQPKWVANLAVKNGINLTLW